MQIMPKPEWVITDKAGSFKAYAYWLNYIARCAYLSDGTHPEMYFFVGEDGAINGAQFDPGFEEERKNETICQGIQKFSPFGTIHTHIMEVIPLNKDRDVTGASQISLCLTVLSRLGENLSLVNVIESTPQGVSLKDTMELNAVDP